MPVQDEPNIVSGKLRYQGTLDVSFYTVYQNDNMLYKAKVNSRPGLPKAVYIIINIFFIIQLVGPCFFVDSTILWDRSSVFTKFMRSIGCIWQLWSGKSRIIGGIVFAVLDFFFELISGVWSGVISKKQVMHKGENSFSLLSGKYLRPLITVLSFSAFAESINSVHTETIAIIYLVFFCLVVLMGPLDLYLISARILVENNPNHEWNQIYPFLSFVVTSALVMLSASVGFVNKTIQAVLMILCAIIYGLFAFYIFIFSPTIKSTFSCITSSLSLSGCITSIISAVFLFTNGVNSAVLIVLYIILFVVCYLCFSFLHKRKVNKYLMIFSQCESNPEEAEEILSRNFKSPRKFISAVRAVFQYWPPYLLSWKPFSIFCQAYPKNSDIILLWIRICALFPQESELFRYLMTQYANLKKDGYSRTSFLSQMLIIQSSRSLESTPSIMKDIASIVKRIEVAHALQFRFWERILQKSVEVFWSNIKSLSRLLDKIDKDIQQMINSYPNNKDIVTLYCSFLQNVKFDFVRYQEWSEKLRQLKEGIPLQPDISVQSARYFLPEIQQYCSDSQVKTNEESSIDIIDTKSSEIDLQHLQVKVSLQELVQRSRIGSITLGIIILILGTVLTILAFVWYSTKFKNRYIDDTLQKSEFMRSINNGLFNFGYLANYVALHPLIVSRALNICTSATDTSQNCRNLMTRIAPTLYPAGKIVPWTYERSYPQNIISVLREKLVAIQFTLGNLTHSKGAKRMYNELFIEPFEHGLTLIQDLLKCSVDATSIIKVRTYEEYQKTDIIINFDLSVNKVANKILEYPQMMLQMSIDEVGDVRLGLDTYFLLTLFAVLVLIALPFNLTYYLLRIESNLVTLAFTTLPNTSVREILHNLNSKNSNNNDNKSGQGSSSQNAFLVNSENDQNDTILMYFIFFISLAMVIACCLYLYYLSFDYADDVNNELGKVSSFQLPGIYSLFVLYRLIRASTFSLIPKVGYPANEIKSYYTKDQHLNISRSTITRLQNGIDFGLWGSQGTVGSYYNTKLEIDYFHDILPTFSSNVNRNVSSVFEELASLDMIEQFDILTKDLHFLHLSAVSDPNLDYLENKFFLPLIYYVNTFAGPIRFPPFFNLVMNNIISGFTELNANISGLIVGVAIVQCLSLLLIIYFLNSKSLMVKRALHMLLFFNPQVILQNQNVMLLLTKRSMRNFEDESSYLDAEKVIENTDEAAVLMDKKLIVTDANNSFLNCVEDTKDQILGKPITEVLRTAPDHKSIEVLMIKLNDVFKGTASPTFKDKITIIIPNGKEKDIVVNVICLTSNGTATETNFHEICAMAFIIDDQTEQRRIEQKIYSEKQKITDMLNKVLPMSVLEELQKGSESISLSVQSASVGCIEVCSTKAFDPNDFNAPFKFLSTVFVQLDEMLKDFPQLTKIRTNSYTYEYAGGLFGSVNKPDKHAEEATRFALKVISSARQIGAKVGFEVEFKIGLSTGGPLVAGVIGLTKPNFHLIGPTVDLAQRMKSSGVFNQVQVTRAVYELIYAYNFHVTERGDIDTGGGKILRTYVINP
ncbi:hypothetical protein M9Y10_011921 [Tritrichomonas musculus]|uniref:Guanylate cyclase domain-containing protein n=1 Tax=Tritrichomonas musculus TaxID=1915356 RepID=A0ABR2IBE3_9EUKA